LKNWNIFTFIFVCAAAFLALSSCFNNVSDITITQTTKITLEEHVYPEYINSVPNEMPSLHGYSSLTGTTYSTILFYQPNYNLFANYCENSLSDSTTEIDKVWLKWSLDSIKNENNVKNIPTSLSDSYNLYSFYLKKNITQDEFNHIIEYLKNADTGISGAILPKYEYSVDLITAIIAKDETKVLTLCDESTIVKGLHYYTPEWVYYNDIENYKKEGLLPSDLIPKMKLYRNMPYSVHTKFMDDLAIEALELKLYTYAVECGDYNSIKDICDYNRDFNMPLPYFIPQDTTDAYVWNSEKAFRNVDPYNNLYSTEDYLTTIDSDYVNEYTIVKGEHFYSMSWVYYNKPTAYKAAEITPDELTAMLPKYKFLGILTEEAMSALEDKINGYAKNHPN
jgi:hypothetical protein